MAALVLGLVGTVLGVKACADNQHALDRELDARVEQRLDSAWKALTGLDDVSVVYTLRTDIGHLQEARRHLEAASKLDHDHGQIRLLEGVYHLASADYDSAIRILDDLLSDNPESVTALSYLGLSHIGNRELPLAVLALERARSLSPSDEVVLFNLASAYFTSSRFEEARGCYEKILQLNPDSAEAYASLGSAYAEDGHYELAIDAFQRALQRDRTNTQYHRHVALSYFQLGDLEQAAIYYQQAVDLDGTDLEARAGLISVLREANRLPEARISQERLDALRITYGYVQSFDPIGQARIMDTQ